VHFALCKKVAIEDGLLSEIGVQGEDFFEDG
jgi:hypothetical protein